MVYSRNPLYALTPFDIYTFTPFDQGCLCACPPRPVDLHARPTRKYLSIFEYIRGIFKEYSENISSTPGSCPT
jgi:hypothetical protein